MRLKGEIVKVYKQTDDWMCFRFRDSKTNIERTSKGNITGTFLPGMKVTIEAEEVVDKIYGKQYNVTKIDSNDSITAVFLSMFISGIGISLAKEIVRTYGEDCIPKIKKNPEILLKVKGIKKKKYTRIVSSLSKTDDIDLMLQIIEFFNNDVTMNQVEKIVQACKDRRKKMKDIKKNPYWLITSIEGFGFKKVDRLALSSGISEFAMERVSAAIVYCLQEMSQKGGHCFSDSETLLKEVTLLIIGKPEFLSAKSYNVFYTICANEDADAIDSFLKKWDYEHQLEKWQTNYVKLVDIFIESLLKARDEGTVVIDDERIYWSELYDAEVTCADIIKNLSQKVLTKRITQEQVDHAINEIEENEGCKLSEEQTLAIKNSLTKRISVITGGPGRGKTTIIKAIIKSWNDDENILLLAPTGRAAKRIKESSGYKAQTIHRFLYASIAGDISADRKLVIVDESSMMGILLAKRLLKYLRNANVIFVGDVDQLASIEPGCFLKDIIASGKVTVSKLTKGFRNGGSIAIDSDLINKGKHLKEFVLDDDTQFVEADADHMLNTILDQYDKLLKEYSVSQIGILTPMRKRGAGCVDLINEAVREKYNPDKGYKNATGFRSGDRVMHIKNDYNKNMRDENWTSFQGVFNGDLGIIKDIDDDYEEVTVLFDDNSEGIFTYEEMKNNFVLAYANTIHKAQGSEYKAVIVVVSSQHSFFLKRNMIYTAFTRAKERLIIVGDEKAIATAARNIDDSVRNSYLKERICA